MKIKKNVHKVPLKKTYVSIIIKTTCDSRKKMTKPLDSTKKYQQKSVLTLNKKGYENVAVVMFKAQQHGEYKKYILLSNVKYNQGCFLT